MQRAGRGQPDQAQAHGRVSLVCGRVIPDCTAVLHARTGHALLLEFVEHAHREHHVERITALLLELAVAHLSDPSCLR